MPCSVNSHVICADHANFKDCCIKGTELPVTKRDALKNERPYLALHLWELPAVARLLTEIIALVTCAVWEREQGWKHSARHWHTETSVKLSLFNFYYYYYYHLFIGPGFVISKCICCLERLANRRKWSRHQDGYVPPSNNGTGHGYIPTALCSKSAIFPQFYIPIALYSHSSMFQ